MSGGDAPPGGPPGSGRPPSTGGPVKTLRLRVDDLCGEVEDCGMVHDLRVAMSEVELWARGLAAEPPSSPAPPDLDWLRNEIGAALNEEIDEALVALFQDRAEAPAAFEALRAGISSGKTMMMTEKYLPQGEPEYVVHWEISWSNLGMTTVQSDEADDLEDAHSIADRLKETRLTLEAADPKDKDIAMPSIDRIWITFLSTREIEVE